MIADNREDIRSQLIRAVVLVVAVFCFFQFTLPYHLFLKEQTQLYLFTANHFLSYFSKPAWMACNLGDFLTQFFFLRGGGATILALLFLVEWVLVMYVLKSFQVQYFVSLYALFPVAAECIMHATLGYQVAHTLSLTLLLVFYGLYTVFRRRWTSLIVGMLLGGTLYSFVGSTALLFPLLVIVYDVVNGRRSWLFWLALIFLTVFMPSYLRPGYLLTERQSWLYPFTQLEQLLASVLVLCCIPLVFLNSYTKARQFERNMLITGSLFFMFLVVGLVKNVDRNREKILAISSEVYFHNWSRADELIDQYEGQNNIVSYYTNIVLGEHSELPDGLLNYYQPMGDGLFLPVGPHSSWLTIFFSSDVYFLLGDMTMAEHSAMLGMIFSPKHRSSRMVKRLAEINLVNEDLLATRKYLRMLDATLFHRKWAAQQEELLQETDSTTTNAWLQYKRSQRPESDTLRIAGDYRTSLTLLVEGNPENKPALDYLLCYYLLHKDLASFVTAYDRWCKGKVDYVPSLYSEALLIYLASKKTSEKEIESYKLPANKVADFVKYTQLFEESEGDGAQLQEKFGQTYWFYLHFAQMVEKER